ncbi:MBL fold metallo-hydrolase [Dehalobacter sp. DCM]|uniref:MBL fold metallo-hydrolase n=1 Tax=Dehalobacter sp. DCM TaxID=2907827 RepID=UPI003081B07B
MFFGASIVAGISRILILGEAKVEQMIIKALVENTSVSEEYKNEHGLCLYIETLNHKLLFDLGASSLFAENAKKLGVDISEVDLVVISHGHYDHGGGLKTFLNVNAKAKIYVNRQAFAKHYASRQGGEKVYIGLDEALMQSERLIFAGEHFIIDQELELFSNIKGRKLISSGNQDLLMESGGMLVQDDFSHEQNLIISEGGKTLLVAGCAHNGIVNIIDHMIEIKHSPPHYVIGGFHLYSRSADKHEDPALINLIGLYLKDTGSFCYTCHCTGIEPYQSLKEIMREKIKYLSTGSQLKILS